MNLPSTYFTRTIHEALRYSNCLCESRNSICSYLDIDSNLLSCDTNEEDQGEISVIPYENRTGDTSFPGTEHRSHLGEGNVTQASSSTRNVERTLNKSCGSSCLVACNNINLPSKTYYVLLQVFPWAATFAIMYYALKHWRLSICFSVFMFMMVLHLIKEYWWAQQHIGASLPFSETLCQQVEDSALNRSNLGVDNISEEDEFEDDDEEESEEVIKRRQLLQQEPPPSYESAISTASPTMHYPTDEHLQNMYLTRHLAPSVLPKFDERNGDTEPQLMNNDDKFLPSYEEALAIKT